MRKKRVQSTVAYCLLLIVYCLFISCGSNPLDVDVSKVKVGEVKIKRFDKDLFSVNETNFNEKNSELKKNYGEYYLGFAQNLIWRRSVDDTLYKEHLLDFVSNADMKALYDECVKNFSDVSDIEKDLTESFCHILFYFPETKLPVAVTTMTGFNSSISFADSFYSIGMEMYLGERNKFYDYAQFPFYKRKVMNRYNIVPDFLKGWAMNTFPQDSSKEDLLSQMIYQGKILYLLDAFLPNSNDTSKIGYSEKQLKWCERNASNIWSYIIENEMLYSSATEDVAKFINEGPFTSGFVKESPARTGIWLGWQIVRKYMERTKSTLKQLMEIKDAKKILDESKYKPN